ncbi:hypothetical protein LZ31DRAFT_601164 [Colletotrichum somersetense]|nr:hypothetical protein LZ31DRAFT_601164 [Colletotrichum somersetense]
MSLNRGTVSLAAQQWPQARRYGQENDNDNKNDDEEEKHEAAACARRPDKVCALTPEPWYGRRRAAEGFEEVNGRFQDEEVVIRT